MRKVILVSAFALAAIGVTAQDKADAISKSAEEYAQEIEETAEHLGQLWEEAVEHAHLNQLSRDELQDLHDDIVDRWVDMWSGSFRPGQYAPGTVDVEILGPEVYWNTQQIPYAAIMDIDGAYLGLSLDRTDNALAVVGLNVEPDATEIEIGDMLISINGVVLDSGDSQYDTLKATLDEVTPGDEVVVVVQRDNKPIELTVPTFPYGDLALAETRFDRRDGREFAREVLRSVRGQAGLLHEQMRDRIGDRLRRGGGGNALSLMDVEGDLASYFDVEDGVLVTNVPRNVDEFKSGDVLTRIGGIPATSAEQVSGILRYLEEPVEIAFLRQGKEHTDDVEFHDVRVRQERVGGEFQAPRGQDSRPWLLMASSLHLLDMDEDLSGYFDVEEGILVVEPREGSELKAGDVLLQIASIELSSARQVNGILRQLDDPVEAKVHRNNKTVEVMLDPIERIQMERLPIIQSRQDRARYGRPGRNGS